MNAIIEASTDCCEKTSKGLWPYSMEVRDGFPKVTLYALNFDGESIERKSEYILQNQFSEMVVVNNSTRNKIVQDGWNKG